MKYIFVLTLLTLISCTTPRQIRPEVQKREPDSVKNLDFQTLKEIIKTNNYSSVDQVLAHLKQSHPGYLAYHNFAINSYSLQSSDFQHPRVIVYGPEADFIITFNSAPDGGKIYAASNALETISYHRESRSFELREIAFKEGALPEDLKAFSRQPYKFSDPNPQKCLACHGVSEEKRFWQMTPHGHKFDRHIRPIWDPYSLWPRMYFSAQSKIGGYAMADGTPEATEYKKFTAPDGNRNKGRYKYLPAFARPDGNEFLTEKLYTYNYQRLVGQLAMKKRAIHPYRYNLIHAFYCARNPQSLRLGKNEKEFADVYETLDARNLSDLKAIDMQMKDSLGRSTTSGSSNSVDMFYMPPILAYAGHFGIDTTEWSTTSYPNGALFQSSDIMGFDLLIALIKEFFTLEEQAYLLPRVDRSQIGPLWRGCEEIQSKVQALP